nr:immunoglobulin light chain junction region [Macaca mulatta]
GNSYADSNVLF